MKNPDKLVVSPKANPWDIDCANDEPITKQEFRDDCNVNVIIARCLKSGLPLPSVTVAPLYADVSEVGSYADCVRRVKSAEDAFMNLPAAIRTEFGNRPDSLIAFLGDPGNKARAIELGLLPKPVPAKPESPPVAGVPPTV